MSLVNLDGTSIFGAGSEWFWAMAQFLLVAGSILGIYFQLRAQRASTLFDQTAALGREWVEEPFLVHRLAALIELEDRPIESGVPGAAKSVGDFFSRIGYLVANKHLRASDVSEMFGWQITFYWRLMAPYVHQDRALLGQPEAYATFERLEQEMRALNPGMAGELTSARPSRAEVRVVISELGEELRRLADARNGIFPAPRSSASETTGAQPPSIRAQSRDRPSSS